jgi:8-oxo-dGTP pyrophosphatase MutT (NUDIX family)
VVLIEKDGQVLLGQRSGSYGAGKWGLPQGFIEFDEDFLSAAIREVKEETGLDVEIRSIISVVSNFLSAPRTIWRPWRGFPLRGRCQRWLLRRTRTFASGIIGRTFQECPSILSTLVQGSELGLPLILVNCVED